MDYHLRTSIPWHLRWLEKRWNCAAFPWDPGKGLNILNDCSLFFIPLRFGSFLAFFYVRISAAYCEVGCSDTYFNRVNLSRQTRHVLFVWGLFSVSLLHAGSGSSLGKSTTVDPGRTVTEAGAWWGRCCGWRSPSCPPHLAAFALPLATYEANRTRRWHSRPSKTCVPGRAEPPPHTPKGAGVAHCVGTDTSGPAGSWELFSCRHLELCPGLFPAPGSTRTSQTPGCIPVPLLNQSFSSVWDYSLCLLVCSVEEFWPAPDRIVQAKPRQGWKQCPSQTFFLTGLRDGADAFLEGKEFPIVETSLAVLLVLRAVNRPCSLVFFFIRCYRGNW